MSLGLKAHEKDNIRTILIRYLESDRLEMLINELDSIKRTLPEELEGYKKANADSIPLKKGSDEYKRLSNLYDDVRKLLVAIDGLPSMAKDMVSYNLGGVGAIMRYVYAGEYKLASVEEILDSQEEFPPVLSIDLDGYSSSLKSLQSAISAALTNARLADKYLRAQASYKCLMVEAVRVCLMDWLPEDEKISYAGGSGTVFESVLSVMLGIGDSKDIIKNCDRNH